MALDFSVFTALLVAFISFLAWIILSPAKAVEKVKVEDVPSVSVDQQINANSAKQSPTEEGNSTIKAPVNVKPSKAKVKALSVRNQSNKFKSLGAISDVVKSSCISFQREIGGHSQAIVDFSFSLNGEMVTTIDVDTIKCVPVSDIGAAVPTDYFCTVDKSQPSTTPGSLKSSSICSVAITLNGKRVLTSCNSTISLYKVPIPSGARCDAGSSYGGTEDRKISLLKQIDCYSPLSGAPVIITGPISPQSRPLRYMTVRSLRVLDVEKWMVVVAAGEYTVPCTVFSAAERENVVIAVDIPCVKAFNHAGREIFHYTPVPKGGYHASDQQAAMGKRSRTKAPGHSATASHRQNLSHYKVTDMLVDVSPNSKYLCISGAGSLDDNHNTDSQGLCSNEIGVFEVVRSGSCGVDSEAVGLQLVFILSSHNHRLRDIAWSFTSSSLVSLVAPLVPDGEECGGWYVWDTDNFAHTNTSVADDSVATINTSAVRLYSQYHPVLVPGVAGNTPTSIALLRRSVDDAIGSIVVVSVESSLHFFGREDHVCYCSLPNITLFPIRSLQSTADGMYVASLVKNAKRIPMWKFAVD